MSVIKRTDFDRLVRDFQFAELFNELGWNSASLNRDIKIEDQIYPLRCIAEKSGFFVMRCETRTVPVLVQRRHINTVFSKVKDFHLIIYTDTARTEQRWQFVLRAPNRPAKNIEISWKKEQDTEALWQRTRGLFFSLDEEDNITIVDVASRVVEAFGANADKVTKKFYDTFKTEHRQFLAFIEGVGTQVDKEWYASLMLNRLMFCYFIQKKGFLDNNLNYLSDKLAQTRKRRGENTFYSFYRDFLLVLFHQGLNEPLPKPETRAEIGQIPYLNGGLFDVHELETSYDIQIPDEAFEKIFQFFDQWEWHLDTRPNASAKEINPDVIGFIFEKYINERADMGAYYTKEDITDYISKNCIIPFLFDQTERNGGRLAPCWKPVQESGDRYIFPSVRHGISWDIRNSLPLEAALQLPAEIEDGLDTSRPNLVERRKIWNREAPPEYGLPTEWWREVVERRLRHEALRHKIDAGEVQAVNDFITLNLDIRSFAQDCLQLTDDPDFLWAFYRALSTLSVLDPTCGSGAFLFAALNVLEPLYEACLDRMAAFAEAGESKHRKNFGDVLAEAADTVRHPSREYFIHKKIIVNNLYGVDLMREAVEIAKLRLFLKLMSTVQPDRRRPNLGLEPLPDVDFNLRAGNSLVGFATLAETIDAINQRDLPVGAQGRLVFGEELEVIAAVREKAELIGMAYSRFKDSQLLLPDGKGLKNAKAELNLRLRNLSATLDEYLAYQYGIHATQEKKKYLDWKNSHQPFHWWAEFYEVLYDEEGRFRGFDVVIGNPPYVQNTQISYAIGHFKTSKCGNLYPIVMERSISLTSDNGYKGFIVPVSSVSTDGYAPLQDLLIDYDLKCCSFDDRPSRLFDGLQHIRLTIHLIGKKRKNNTFWSSKYHKWNSLERNVLFDGIAFVRSNSQLFSNSLPKIYKNIELPILEKMQEQRMQLYHFQKKNSEDIIFFSRKVGYFLQVLDFEPIVYDRIGNVRPPSEFKSLYFDSHNQANAALCVLNSNLFYWFITVFSDCRHLNKREVDAMFINLEKLVESKHQAVSVLSKKLMEDFQMNSEFRKMKFKHDELNIQCIISKHSKPIIDQIDTVLAEHYGFTEEELDFIINYDIKYRMGRGSGEEEE